MNCVSFVVIHILLLIALHFKTSTKERFATDENTHGQRNYVGVSVTVFGSVISLGCDYIATNATINFKHFPAKHTVNVRQKELRAASLLSVS